MRKAIGSKRLSERIILRETSEVAEKLRERAERDGISVAGEIRLLVRRGFLADEEQRRR